MFVPAAVVTVLLGGPLAAGTATASAQTYEIPENSPVGTVVGTLADAGASAGETVYTLAEGNDAGPFAVDAKTGRITVRDPQRLDFETQREFRLRVVATTKEDGSDPVRQRFIKRLIDAGADQARIDELLTTTRRHGVTVRLTDVNEPPVVHWRAKRISPESPAGTEAAVVSARDPDIGDRPVFSLANREDARAFHVDPLTGRITVVDAGAMAIEGGRAQVPIDVTDRSGAAAVAWVVIEVHQVVEAPRPALPAVAVGDSPPRDLRSDGGPVVAVRPPAKFSRDHDPGALSSSSPGGPADAGAAASQGLQGLLDRAHHELLQLTAELRESGTLAAPLGVIALLALAALLRAQAVRRKLKRQIRKLKGELYDAREGRDNLEKQYADLQSRTAALADCLKDSERAFEELVQKIQHSLAGGEAFDFNALQQARKKIESAAALAESVEAARSSEPGTPASASASGADSDAGGRHGAPAGSWPSHASSETDAQDPQREQQLIESQQSKPDRRSSDPEADASGSPMPLDIDDESGLIPAEPVEPAENYAAKEQMQSMRQIANRSARSAIARYRSKRKRKSQLIAGISYVGALSVALILYFTGVIGSALTAHFTWAFVGIGAIMVVNYAWSLLEAARRAAVRRREEKQAQTGRPPSAPGAPASGQPAASPEPGTYHEQESPADADPSDDQQATADQEAPAEYELPAGQTMLAEPEPAVRQQTPDPGHPPVEPERLVEQPTPGAPETPAELESPAKLETPAEAHMPGKVQPAGEAGEPAEEKKGRETCSEPAGTAAPVADGGDEPVADEQQESDVFQTTREMLEMLQAEAARVTGAPQSPPGEPDGRSHDDADHQDGGPSKPQTVVVTT